MRPQEPEDLFETISQTLLNAVDRDALSGWGALVHVMSVAHPIPLLKLICFSTHDKVITRTLRARMD